MGFILVVAVLSLAIFVYISNMVFSLVARARTTSRSSAGQTKSKQDRPSLA
jgi:hypothetical protein